LNIGIVTTWFERGAAIVSRQYMDILNKKHNVYIFVRGGEYYAKNDKKWNIENVTWGMRIPDSLGRNLDLRQFKKWIKTNNISNVLFNEQQHWKILVDIKKTFPELVIGSYVDYYTAATIELFWIYDYLLCNTKRHYSVFQSHPQCFYIPWGTNINIFQYDGKVKGEKGPAFFHSCGMSPNRKGTSLLVKAFDRLDKDDSRLIIHAQKGFSKWNEETDNIILQNNNIELIIKTISAPGAYHYGDVYVYPSILDGLGLTIAEALSCGLPVITTNEPPMNEFIIEGINGKLVKVNNYKAREDGYYWPLAFCDIESLRKALTYYIENFSEMSKFKEKAREHAVENLSWERNAEGLCQLFENLSIIETKHSKRLCSIILAKWKKDIIINIINIILPNRLISIIYKLYVKCKKNIP